MTPEPLSSQRLEIEAVERVRIVLNSLDVRAIFFHDGIAGFDLQQTV